MTGKTDVRVRPHLTFSVTAFHVTDNTGASREIASGMTADAANEVAQAVYNASDAPGALTTARVYTETVAAPERSWFTAAYRALRLRTPGAQLLLALDHAQNLEPQLQVTWIVPEPHAMRGVAPGVSPQDAQGNAEPDDSVQAVVDTVKDRVLREISRINLPERWDDLSRETTRRGLEAFMALQMAAKETWRDHEIEGLVNRIALRTGKAKNDLRRMVEAAQERVAEAQRSKDVQADLHVRQEHYCRNRAKGLDPEQAARHAGFRHPHAVPAALLEVNGRIQRRIEELRKEYEAQANQVAGSERLENASQEFFALNVGFYGMTADAAAKQMSLPLETADGLMQTPAVQERIKFLARCNARGRKS